MAISAKEPNLSDSFIAASSSFAVPKQTRPKRYLVAEVHPPILGLAVHRVAVLEVLVVGVLSTSSSVWGKYAGRHQSVGQRYGARAYGSLVPPLYRCHFQDRLAELNWKISYVTTAGSPNTRSAVNAGPCAAHCRQRQLIIYATDKGKVKSSFYSLAFVEILNAMLLVYVSPVCSRINLKMELQPHQY